MKVPLNRFMFYRNVDIVWTRSFNSYSWKRQLCQRRSSKQLSVKMKPKKMAKISKPLVNAEVNAKYSTTEVNDVEKTVQSETFQRKTVKIKMPNNLSKLRAQIKAQSPTEQSASVVDNQIPMDKPSETSMKWSESDIQNFTVFLKDNGVILDVTTGAPMKQDVEIPLPDQQGVLQLNFDYDDGLKIDRTSPSERVDAVSEFTWREIKPDYSKLVQYYLSLSKIRLTGLVVVTTMAGYAVAPDPFLLGTFLMCSVGTALTSCSANAMNQYFEVPFDAQMNRTKNRVIVREYLSPLHAVTFAVITGWLGLAILTLGVNPLTATLGFFNLGLYTLVYTPMKRYSILNTWVGSIVGAIPPMMGWTACTGMLEPGALLLGAILYAWQFPHFNALSWNLRPDYCRGGYRMCSVVRPEMCKRVALRYSVGMIALCSVAPLVDLTTWTFAVDSLPLNVYLTYLAWNFYRKGDSNSSRKLFRFTLVHIPVLLLLMLIGKKPGRENKSDDSLTLQPITGQELVT